MSEEFGVGGGSGGSTNANCILLFDRSCNDSWSEWVVNSLCFSVNLIDALRVGRNMEKVVGMYVGDYFKRGNFYLFNKERI